MNGVDGTDFMLRLLVKKDVDLSTKTFLSCRLACTEALYTKFMYSSFWPPHVMIGEFIETPRPPRQTASASDFMSPKASTSADPAKPNPSTPKTHPPKPTVLKEAILNAASKNSETAATMETS